MDISLTPPDWARFIVSDFTDMDRNPEPVATGTLSFSLPDDAYFEYAFLDEAGTLNADPANPHRADNPWYLSASAIVGKDFRMDSYAKPTASADGRVLRLRLESAQGQTRRTIAYTPKGYEAQALPTVYIQDGVAYYRIARLADVLEKLLEEGRVKPAHLVFIEPIDRFAEYRFNREYLAFMTGELVPFIEGELQTTAERIVMGASLGGLVSSVLALEHPDMFQTVITQSGAFLGSPEEPDFYRGKSSWVLDRLGQLERLPLRWYSETGTIEWLTGINRSVHEVLETKGYTHAYAERNAGHNWVNWRNGLGSALTFALT